MRRPWVLIVAAMAPLSGCGGGDGNGGRAVTLPAGRPLSVKADEYSFDPDEVTVREPGELRIVLRNEGSLPHDLRVFRGKRKIGGTPVFKGGERSARVRLTAGRYRFVCTVGDHERLGMVGSLTVR
jgi:plastocyanin